jgi:hypothetical protein
MREYRLRLAELAEKHNVDLPNAMFHLVIDQNGRIHSWTLHAPTVDAAVLRRLRDDLALELKTWEFPMVEKQTGCTLSLPIYPLFDTHMNEMMMAPMGDNETDKVLSLSPPSGDSALRRRPFPRCRRGRRCPAAPWGREARAFRHREEVLDPRRWPQRTRRFSDSR